MMQGVMLVQGHVTLTPGCHSVCLALTACCKPICHLHLLPLQQTPQLLESYWQAQAHLICGWSVKTQCTCPRNPPSRAVVQQRVAWAAPWYIQPLIALLTLMQQTSGSPPCLFSDFDPAAMSPYILSSWPPPPLWCLNPGVKSCCQAQAYLVPV